MNRREFAGLRTEKNRKILEIGPSYQPIYPKKDGWNVEIADHLPRSGLMKKLASFDVEAIEEVDYVCTDRYSDVIPHRQYYDVIMGSHIIEHMLDFIGFFEDCDKLLSPDGMIKLIVRFCRYESDCLREVSSLRSVIDTHYWRKDSQRTAHTIGTVSEYMMLEAVIPEYGAYVPDSMSILDGRMRFLAMDPRSYAPGKRIPEDYHEDEYIDLHNWTFTPKSFELLVYELNVLGFLGFQIDWIHKDPESMEFYVILKRGKVEKIDRDYMLKALSERKLEALECMRGYITEKWVMRGYNFISGFYVDTGQWYSEKTKIEVVAETAKNSNSAFSIEAVLPPGTRKVRWDPVEGRKLVLTDLTVHINQVPGKLLRTNGISTDFNKYLFFDTRDPQIEYEVPQSNEPVSISVSGRIAFL